MGADAPGGLATKIAWFFVHGAGSILEKTLLSPLFVGAVAFILVLERLRPVDPKQPTFSAGLLQDGGWMIFALSFEALIVGRYTHALKTLYDAHLSFLTLDSFARLPSAARFLIGILLADFLAWFQHWLKHKVPWFWQFHAVHHSQRQINLFTDFRFHFLEYLVSRPIVMLPLMIFANDAPKIVAYTLLTAWQTRLYHANIRSNFGWLRYVLVNPQSHRVHHSAEKRHTDLNFGVVFSFWDRLFRTQYGPGDEYPKTGIHDAAFPLEISRSPFAVLVTGWRQTVYPLRVIGRSLVGAKTGV